MSATINTVISESASKRTRGRLPAWSDETMAGYAGLMGSGQCRRTHVNGLYRFTP